MHVEINGKTFEFEYNAYTKFKIQVGKGKSSYDNRFVTGNLNQALLLYNGINIGNGYKKRLLLDNPNLITVLAKAAS